MAEDDLMVKLGNMMQTMNAAQVVHAIVSAYDNCALAALKALMGGAKMAFPGEESEPTSPYRLARDAWAIADAMMAERFKRGLGKLGDVADQSITP